MRLLTNILRAIALLGAVAFNFGCSSGNRDTTTSTPTVAAVLPTHGAQVGGTTLTIQGSNFRTGATVAVGGQQATNVVVVDDATITATTPSGVVGAADVAVTTSQGTGRLVGAFTYDAPPLPALTGVAPMTGLEIGGTTVALTGTNFLAGATVTFGGMPATAVVVNSSTSLTATTPSGQVGPCTVAVTTANGTVSVANAFSYLDADPTFSANSPTTGSESGGTLITLTGNNFLAPVTVTVGGVAATSVTVVDTTTVTAITPVGVAGAADIVVTTPHGAATRTGGFTFTPASLFVTNSGASSWSVHGLASNGDQPPLRTVVGGQTGIASPIGLCVAGGNVYVADIAVDVVAVFPTGATGDVAPTQLIGGVATLLDGPTGVYVDLTRQEIFTANVYGNLVTVHDATSNGNVAPLRVLSGANTGIVRPEGVTGHDGELYVANVPLVGSTGRITVHGLTDAGNVAPRRTIEGLNTGLANPQGLCVADGFIYVANTNANSITVYPTTATGDVAPARTISGGNTLLNQPQACWATATELYVASNGNSSVLVYPIAADGNVAPTRTISGASTGFTLIEGLVVR